MIDEEKRQEKTDIDDITITFEYDANNKSDI
jgi:hypothetical protein